MNKYLLTIYVLTYNRANYLKQQLDSIQSQSFRDFYVVILDNHSMDNTPDIVKPYLEDVRFSYIRHEKNIEGDNYVYPFLHCDTDYFMITHDDDIMMPTLVEEEFNCISNSPNVNMVFTHIKNYIDADGNIHAMHWSDVGEEFYKRTEGEYVHIKKNQYIEYYMQGINFICCPTIMLRRKPIQDTHLQIRTDVGKSADTYFFFQVNQLEGEMVFINKFLYKYRFHSGQDSVNWLYMVPLLRNPVYKLYSDNSIKKRWLKYVLPYIERAIAEAKYKKNEYQYLKNLIVLNDKIDLDVRISLYLSIFFPFPCIFRFVYRLTRFFKKCPKLFIKCVFHPVWAIKRIRQKIHKQEM